MINELIDKLREKEDFDFEDIEIEHELSAKEKVQVVEDFLSVVINVVIRVKSYYELIKYYYYFLSIRKDNLADIKCRIIDAWLSDNVDRDVSPSKSDIAKLHTKLKYHY